MRWVPFFFLFEVGAGRVVAAAPSQGSAKTGRGVRFAGGRSRPRVHHVCPAPVPACGVEPQCVDRPGWVFEFAPAVISLLGGYPMGWCGLVASSGSWRI